MTPPVETWPARDLAERAQLRPSVAGTSLTARKGLTNNGDLSACQLLEMVQYTCDVEEPRTRESLTRCWPVERLFRRCQDRNGSFMVETTAWEGSSAKKS